MTATEYVVLVDQNDQEIGLEEKLIAHQKNLLHRAFSVFIFRNNPQRELLLQQRAMNKYHSPGLWTNTCCSHPRSAESVITAGERRLQEEMGIKTDLKDIGSFVYNVQFENGLWEHELDHVLIGTISGEYPFTPNTQEVANYRWVSIQTLENELAIHPKNFTPWLPLALPLIKNEKCA